MGAEVEIVEIERVSTVFQNLRHGHYEDTWRLTAKLILSVIVLSQ